MSTFKPFFAFIASAVFLVILPASVMLNQSGAPAKRTGAPGDGDGSPGNNGSCADVGCHNSFDVNSGPGEVTIEAPDEYLPGIPVDFIVAVHDTTRFRYGFQVTIKNAEAENVGTFELIDGSTRFATGDENYVTHTLANSLSMWTVRWNPPAELTDDVTIYAAGNSADNRFTAANDYVYETSSPLLYSTSADLEEEEAPSETFELSIFPNPASTRLNIEFQTSQADNIELGLYDSLGKLVKTLPARTRAPGAHVESIDVADLSAGVYFVRLQSELGSTDQPISIIR